MIQNRNNANTCLEGANAVERMMRLVGSSPSVLAQLSIMIRGSEPRFRWERGGPGFNSGGNLEFDRRDTTLVEELVICQPVTSIWPMVELRPRQHN